MKGPVTAYETTIQLLLLVLRNLQYIQKGQRAKRSPQEAAAHEPSGQCLSGRISQLEDTLRDRLVAMLAF